MFKFISFIFSLYFQPMFFILRMYSATGLSPFSITSPISIKICNLTVQTKYLICRISKNNQNHSHITRPHHGKVYFYYIKISFINYHITSIMQSTRPVQEFCIPMSLPLVLHVFYEFRQTEKIGASYPGQY